MNLVAMIRNGLIGFAIVIGLTVSFSLMMKSDQRSVTEKLGDAISVLPQAFTHNVKRAGEEFGIGETSGRKPSVIGNSNDKAEGEGVSL
jgi:hypothetical protein